MNSLYIIHLLVNKALIIVIFNVYLIEFDVDLFRKFIGFIPHDKW